MRLMAILLLLGLLGGLCAVPAVAVLSLRATVGFGGYYRTNTLVPIAVQVENTGDTERGEFRVSCDNPEALPHTYRTPITIPTGARQLHFLYVIPEMFSREFTISYWSHDRKVAATKAIGQEVYEFDRLLVTVGGTASTLGFLRGQEITSAAFQQLRPWNNTQGVDMYSMSVRGMQTGHIDLVNIDGKLLPGNPEAYGSISNLALMSDVTENSLSDDVQHAITEWVDAGGHLLVSGGGTQSRLQAPFFSHLLPSVPAMPAPAIPAPVTPFPTPAPHIRIVAPAAPNPIIGEIPAPTAILSPGTSGATIVSSRVGAGRVTTLSFDPDLMTVKDWKQAGFVYTRILQSDAKMPLAVQMFGSLTQATMPRRQHPPRLSFIIIYLIAYLLLLVPVNYFILKKLDRRELAWITTPAIALLFTFGAYGIGYVMKGNQLILTTFSLVETSARHSTAMATSHLLAFSPARKAYSLHLGESGLLVNPISIDRGDGTATPARFDMVAAGNELRAERVLINMWDYRRFVTMHRVEMGGGIDTTFANQYGAIDNITNRTPYNFTHCRLYQNGSQICEFSLARGETFTLNQSPQGYKPFTQDTLGQFQSDLNAQLGAGGMLADGRVLVGYTEDIHIPIRLDRQSPAATPTVVVFHL